MNVFLTLTVFTGALINGLPASGPREERDRREDLPPPLKRQVDFHKEVLPLLSRRCATCHAGGKIKGKFSIETRDTLLKGGSSGPAVLVGKSGESLLIELVAGVEPERIMPAEGPKLNDEEIGLLRAWIDQGLSWEEGVTLAAPYKTAPLSPRRVEISKSTKSRAVGALPLNPIDAILSKYFVGTGQNPDVLVSDRTFARRVSLDITGLLPNPDEVISLERDTRPDKRLLYVRDKLADRKTYAEHWMTFWNDALRNAYRGTGFIDDGRQQITPWLFKALYENLPYDQFVQDLIAPEPGSVSHGFVYGIKWRGVVNASQRREMQAAQSVAQVFLGINIKCASCHDSFINGWKLDQAYGLANVFADETLDVHRCDKPTGEKAKTSFLFPELGDIDGSKPKAERLKQLADLTTDRANGRFARTIVNRLWARLLGRGLVETVDDMDQDPWDADLLDWLAVDLTDYGYDLKHTIELICTSRAYQMPSVGVPTPEQHGEPFVFRGPFVRRLNAEEFIDAVAQLTGNWPEATPAMRKMDGRKQGGQLSAILGVLSEADKRGNGAGPERLRALYLDDEPLLRALGRSNREQVVTRRESIATTLEALELSNGETLDSTLKKGAETWLSKGLKTTAELIDAVYMAALCRSPTANERASASELVGEDLTAENVEDLLWAIVMLPEFQLID